MQCLRHLGLAARFVSGYLMVESSETSAQRAASSSDTSGRMMRSRIGFPYLLSPSCRYGVSGEHQMQLPSG